MKGSSLLLLLVFVAAGYVLHPMVVNGLRDAGVVAKAEESPEQVVVKKVEDKEDKAVLIPEVDVDLSDVTAEDFPDKVTLLQAVSVVIPGSSTKVPLSVGTDVKPVGLEGDVLIFEPLGIQTQGRVAVDQTNFKQRIKPILDEKARIAAAGVDLKKEGVVPEPDVAKVEPKPEPEPEPEESGLTEDQAISLMQSNVKEARVKEFTFEQVVGWKLDGTETVDGEEYQVGVVVYNAETLFGPQKLQVKALIQDGKVAKWVWAKTGVEVR